jgi:5-methylcytosine-specific restriction endonuclease McrA
LAIYGNFALPLTFFQPIPDAPKKTDAIKYLLKHSHRGSDMSEKRRPFDFPDTVKDEARLRQFGLCACCGDSLDDEWEEAHHVVPNQSGDPTNPEHSWLRTLENCVVLCDQCHHVAHGENTLAGPVAPPEYYSHSHGQDLVRHRDWVGRLNVKAALLWGPKIHNRLGPRSGS